MKTSDKDNGKFDHDPGNAADIQNEAEKECTGSESGSSAQTDNSVGGAENKADPGNGFASYSFMGISLDSPTALARELLKNRDEGKRHFTDGLLTKHFAAFDKETADYLSYLEQENGKHPEDTDLYFARVIYRLDDSMKSFLWKDREFASCFELGQWLYGVLKQEQSDAYSVVRDILGSGFLQEYANAVICDSSLASKIEGVEAEYELCAENSREELLVFYALYFCLCDVSSVRIDGNDFEDVASLASFMTDLFKRSYADFERFCTVLAIDRDTLDTELEAWLILQGYKGAIGEWRQAMS